MYCRLADFRPEVRYPAVLDPKAGKKITFGVPNSPAQDKMNMSPAYPDGVAAQAIRDGQWRRPTAGLAPGFVQANLVILPQSFASDFLCFCIRNPKPCPVLDATLVGSPHPNPKLAAMADLRTDLPRYLVYKHGEVERELTDITGVWQDDFVAFLTGCSFTFEHALLSAGVPVRHLERGCNVPMFRTSWPCEPAGVFQGPLVVSMRPIPNRLLARCVQVTSRYPSAHGAPLYIGDPAELGIADLEKPDFGDPVPINANETPVFWACGVTPQAVAQSARLPLMVTHAPGHMFVTDRMHTELECV